MSSKLASQTTGGRRTPLSLGSTTAQKSNPKLSTESNPPDSTTIDLRNRKSDDKSQNVEKTDSPAKNSSAKETTNNSTENKKEKTSKKDSINSQENGHDDEKQNSKDEKQSSKDEKPNSQKDDTSKKTEKKAPRDSPRNKDMLKTDAKENNKDTEKAKPSVRSKSPDKEKDKRTIPNEKKERKDQNDMKKTPVEEAVLPKRSSRANTLAQQVAKQEPVTLNVTTDSLKLQQDLRGFGDSIENDVEMESLLLDVDVSESATAIPTAAKSSAHSPSLRSSTRKPTIDEVKEKQPTQIPRRSMRKEVSLRSPPQKLPPVEIPVTSTPDGSTFYSLPPTSLRQISGRRSLRPLKEYTFQYNSNYRESYRRTNTEFDCTNNTSMNVTVGSEITPQSESFISSFFSFGRGKKRSYTPPLTVSTADEIQDDAVNTNTASPKRPRLDLSGLIGLVTSPVVMIKNRIYRGKVDSSTPNNKTEDLDDVDADEDGVESVSEIISEEKKIILEEEKNDDNENNDEDATIDLDDEEESNDEKEKSVEHLNKVEIGDDVISDNEANNEEVLNSNRRGRCHIM